jgi:hypothetical protein
MCGVKAGLVAEVFMVQANQLGLSQPDKAIGLLQQ